MRIGSASVIVAIKCCASMLVLFAAATENATTPTESSLHHQRIFFLNSYKLTYMRGDNATDQLGIKLTDKTGVASIDYHPMKNRLYYSTPRVGFWRKNARIYSLPWDYRYDCNNSDENCQINDEKNLLTEKGDDGVRRSYVSTGKVEVLREENYWNPRSLAVDYINDKIYYVDTADRSVNVINLDGNSKSTIFEDEPLIPYEVAIDPAEGLMFVFVANTRTGYMQIYRVNMDGSEPTLLLDYLNKNRALYLRDKIGFALDAINKRIYFSNIKEELIDSVNYNGERWLIAMKMKNPSGIGVRNDTLYWYEADVHSTSLLLCTKSTCSLNTCKLNTTLAICIPGTARSLIQDKRLDYATNSIKLIDPTLQKVVDNPCANGNGCQHHCLLKKLPEDDGLGYGCACNKGWWLKRDKKGCTREMITYMYDDFYIPYFDSFTSMYEYNDDTNFYPISRNLLVRLTFSRADTVFVQEPSDFIRIDDSSSKLMKKSMLQKDALSNSTELDDLCSSLDLNPLDVKDDTDISVEDVKVYDNRTIGKVVTYDWITKNLYYVSIDDKVDESELLVLKYDRPDRIVRQGRDSYPRKLEKSLGKISNPEFMAIHPYSGYIFAVLRNGSVNRFNTDGTNQTQLVNVQNVTVVAIDFTDDRLYYIDMEAKIHHVSLDGSDPKSLSKTSTSAIDFMYIYDKWIYVKSEKDNRFWRYNKETGKDSGTLENKATNFLFDSVGMKVTAKDARYVNEFEHPCVESNGGCEGFCFGVTDEESLELKKVCG